MIGLYRLNVLETCKEVETSDGLRQLSPNHQNNQHKKCAMLYSVALEESL